MRCCAGAMASPMGPEQSLRDAYGEDARRTCSTLRRELEEHLAAPEAGRKAFELTLHGLKGVASALEVGEGGALCHALEELLRTPEDWVPFPALLPALLQGLAELEQQALAFEAGVAVPPVSSLLKSLLSQALGEAPFPPGEGRWPEPLIEAVDDELEALFEAHRKAPPVPSASQAPVPEGALASLGDFLALQAEALAAELGKVVAFRAELPGLALASDRLSDLRTQLGHLLRNALDHGLETPEGRRAAGKAEQGVLRLEGTVEDDILTLTLADDGAGLALEALKARAREAGLLESNSALSPLDLLCLPGASVRAQASHLSGRGVGLAAVRGAVEGWGGALSVTTEPGQGTAFRLTVPLDG